MTHGRRRRALAGAMIALAFAAPAAAGVEKGRFGLNAELHAQRSIGVTYHASRRFAVRPSFFFERTESDSVPSFVDATQPIPVFQTTDTIFGGAADLLYFLAPAKDLAPYVGALLSYSHVNEPYQVRSPEGLVLRNGNRAQIGASAAFGVQYALDERFQVFGHVAAGYTRGERFAIDGIRLKSSTWGTASTAIGVVFYFD